MSVILNLKVILWVKKISKRLIGGMLVVLSMAALAVDATTSAPSAFELGRQHFREQDFEAAIQSFEQAVQAKPTRSEYHHWLARAYGRLAERSSWLRAIELAKKTRASLERAVEFDPHNTDALLDLMDYYRSAPGFLGGSRDRAEQIRLRLEDLRNNNAGKSTTPAPSR